MANMEFDIEFISGLMELVKQNDMGELTIENGGIKIKIKAKRPAEIIDKRKSFNGCKTFNGCDLNDGIGEADPSCESESVCDEPSGQPAGNKVVSPIVGTFYAAPSPDRDPFVKVGQKVKKGDVLFIIESMKLMNEIQSEFDGEVAEILCTDGQAVEFGQPIVIIK